MTQPHGMIADTWHLGAQLDAPAPAEQTGAADHAAAVATGDCQPGLVGGGPQIAVPKITSGPIHRWGALDDAALKALRAGSQPAATPAPRLELHERDARLVALDLAIRTLETGATKTEITARAEAFLAFLAGGGSGN